MSAITTHVLDLVRGKPAAGISVTLEMQSGRDWKAAGSGATDANGRCGDLLAAHAKVARGVYRLRFDVAAYFRVQGTETFYPEISIAFEVRDPGEHYHVPLLLSPCGYTTYRGS